MGSILQLSDQLTFPTAQTPPVSDPGTCALYFDGLDLYLSENGGAWTAIAGVPAAGGWTDTGTHVRLTTATDTISAGAAALLGAEKLRLTGDGTNDGLRLDGQPGAPNTMLEMDDGSSAAVSNANEGRIRYNTITQQWEGSENGGAYVPFCQVGEGGWQELATVVQLETITDTVAIGAAAMVGTEKLLVVGDSILQGNAWVDAGPLGVNINPALVAFADGVLGVRSTQDAGSGVSNLIQHAKSGAGAIVNMANSSSGAVFTGTGTVTDFKHFECKTTLGGGDAVTNAYGLYVEDQQAGLSVTNGYGLYCAGANDDNVMMGRAFVGIAVPAGGEIFRVGGAAQIDTTLDVVGNLTTNGKPVTPYTDTGAMKIANYPAVIDDLIRVDPTAGSFTVTLPTAVGVKNRAITIKEVGGSATAVLVNTTGGQSIDGVVGPPADTLSTAYGAVTYISDGSNWMKFT